MNGDDDNFVMGDYASPDPDQLARERAIRFRSNADNMSIQPPGPSPPVDAPPQGPPQWLMGALAAQDQYRPREDYPLLPDVGPPAISAGSSSISEGVPWANRLRDAWLKPSTWPEPKDDIGRAIDLGLSFSGGGLATKAPKVKATAPGEILKAVEPAPFQWPSGVAQPINNPLRMANPGVYQRPDVIAAAAAANVAPEHPALKQLFGVTRDDLYQISQQGRRQGNIEPQLWAPGKATKTSEAAANIMTPANAQRIVDTLTEAQKYPELIKGMVPWYVMDPAYQQMVKLVGPERAAKEYHDFNMSVAPFSAGSPVPTEINRGTAANMMRMRGEFPAFQQYGGMPPGNRPEDIRALLQGVQGHLMHKNPAAAVANYIKTGEHGFDPNTVKIPLYAQASGVPQTGFQTKLPVPDTHFAGALGFPEVRTSADYRGYLGGPEYRPTGPWFRENIAKPMNIEAVPAQALMWGVYAPQTGVRTAVGAGKLELLAKNIWERAQQLGVDPHWLRDQVLLGKQHAELAAQDKYA